jgi:hypothetical protein
MNQPFHFYSERRLVTLTGRVAHNLAGLRQHLTEVSGSSIFFHTHHQYLSHQFGATVLEDDFAAWISRSLLEEQLAEKISAIDPLRFASIREMRNAIVASIDRHLASTGRSRDCVPGDEFHFCESQSFILPSGMTARTVEEFAACLGRASLTSLYFHFFEARLRLERPTNDFSQWFRHAGEEEIALEIDRIYPYGIPLERLLGRILDAIGVRAAEVLP